MASPFTPTPTDLSNRIRALLPGRWFRDTTPVLDVVLAGLTSVTASLFGMLNDVRAQTRIATAVGSGLDMIAFDFFGALLKRQRAQSDTALRAAIGRELLRARATRLALDAVVTDLTGRHPIIFEPARAMDTGAWGRGAGYGVAGGWGSLALPFQCFIDVYPPGGVGISQVAGWNVAGAWGRGLADASQPGAVQPGVTGPIEYASLTMLAEQVSQAEINAAIAAVLPAGAIAWVRIKP